MYKMSSANDFNLDKSKILLFGKKLIESKVKLSVVSLREISGIKCVFMKADSNLFLHRSKTIDST